MAPGDAPAAPGWPRAALATGGALVLVASLVPWATRGAGSAIALRRVGDLLLSGTIEAWAPRWAGLVVYAVPLGGALLVLGAGLAGRPGRAVTVAGLAAAALGSALVLLALARLGRAEPGPGLVLVGVGLVLGLAGCVGARPAGVGRRGS